MSSDRLDELIRDRLSPDGQVLSLKAQFIREVGAKALAQKEELKNLRTLDLTMNDIGAVSYTHLTLPTILLV